MASDAKSQKSDAGELPAPLCSKEGDLFERVVFNDDVPFIMQRGGFVYVLLNAANYDGLHVINTEDGLTLVGLTRIANNKVHVESYHSSYPSYDCDPTKLHIHGIVTELYPTGSTGRRWLLYQEGLEYNAPHERLYLVPDNKR
jgi:hypothetical protein